MVYVMSTVLPLLSTRAYLSALHGDAYNCVCPLCGGLLNFVDIMFDKYPGGNEFFRFPFRFTPMDSSPCWLPSSRNMPPQISHINRLYVFPAVQGGRTEYTTNRGDGLSSTVHRHKHISTDIDTGTEPIIRKNRLLHIGFLFFRVFWVYSQRFHLGHL